MPNDQILYRLLIDVLEAKARGGWSYLSPNLTIFIRTLRTGDNRVGDSSVTKLMDGCCQGQSRAIFHTFPYSGGEWGRGFLHCL